MPRRSTPTRAERNGLWIEKHCRQPEGAHVGKPLVLHASQWAILEGIYDGQTTQAIITYGRKNGKSTFSACIALLHTAGPEAAPNSQIYSSANSREQAAITFNLALKMVRMDQALHDVIQVREAAKQMLCPELGTIYTALSAEDKTAHGLSPKVTIHDELGQVRGPRSALYDALETGGGAHEETLSIIISTQARSDGDLLSIIIDDAQREEDSDTKLFMWSAPKDADPFVEETWKAANPLYGHALNPAYVKKLAKRAKRMPSSEASFRNLVLNQRVDAETPFIPLSVWKACAAKPDRSLLLSHPVYAGLDLSGRTDLTALAYGVHVDGLWHVWCDFWTPKVTIHDRATRDRVPYDVWATDGWIEALPGGSIDYDSVAIRIARLCAEFDVRAIAFDRWRIDVLAKALERIDCEPPLVPFGQGFKDMSPALDEFESAAIGTKILHGGNPVLMWCVMNAFATEDPAGNRKLDKKRATGRIDGAVALAMMLGAPGKEGEGAKDPGMSIYEVHQVG